MKFPQGSYSDTQFAVIQTTFENICADLGIGETETKRRACVAKAVMRLANVGEYDPDKLKSYAISRLKTFDSEGPRR